MVQCLVMAPQLAPTSRHIIQTMWTKKLKYDPELSKKLLSEAGFSEGFTTI